MEIGSIILSTSATVPEGYLVCDGSAIDRDLYAELFEVIGTTYGDGDGSSTFNLPDLRGQLPMGIYTGADLGDMLGEETHILTDGELAAHGHEAPSHTHANTILAQTPTLSHNITQAVFQYSRLGGTSNVTTASSNGRYNGNGTSTMSRATNLSVAAHNASACTMSGGVTDCPAFDTESAGSGAAHDNMMPYLTLTYLIYAPETVYEPGMTYYNGCLPVGPSGCYIVGKG